jgi:hypothetical protein
MNVFLINFYVYIRSNIPYVLKYFNLLNVEILQNWVVALLSPLDETQVEFRILGGIAIDDAMTTSEVIVFEKMINKRFSPSNGGIYVSNNANMLQNKYIYTRQEQLTNMYLYRRTDNMPTYLHTRQEYDSEFDCIINIPLAHVPNTPEITKKINAYICQFLLAGINYKINYY